MKEAGWGDDQIIEQYRITDGRIIRVGTRHRRADALRADYVLEYRPGVPIGVVEAKRQYSTPVRACNRQRITLNCSTFRFAYSTNGVSIVEDDRNTGIERADLSGVPVA